MNNIIFFFIEAVIGMKRSAMMIIISKITILVSLLIFGLFLMVNLNLSSMSKHITDQLEVKLFLKEGLTKREITQFQTKLTNIDGVKNVAFQDKKKSWNTFKEVYPKLALTSYLTENPLPHTLVVRLNDSKKIEQFSTIIKAYSQYCEEVSYGGRQGQKLQKIADIFLYSGWGLVGILSLATFLIMMNTINLTIINRNEEISIMKLVGATDGFITGPFILEGLILGISSSLIAVGVLSMFYKWFLEKLLLFFPYFPLVQTSGDLVKIYAAVMLWGICLSSFAAFLSLKGSLRKML